MPGRAVDLREADAGGPGDLAVAGLGRCSCRTTSWTWRRPDAPIGSPLASSPPSVLTGSRPPISSLAVQDQPRLLTVLAEAGLGEVHDLGAGLGVLELGDIDSSGPTPAVSNAARPRATVAPR